MLNSWDNQLLCDELQQLLLESNEEKKINSRFVSDLFSIEALINKIL